jgi:hypothetical protein
LKLQNNFQKSAKLSAPSLGQQAGDEVIAEATKFEVGAIAGATRSDAAGTKMTPTSHMTWELAAPQLDPFGNETVPIFNSPYSGR